MNNWGRLKADWRPLWLAIVKLVSRYILHTLPKQYTKSPFLNDLQSRHPSIFALFVNYITHLGTSLFCSHLPRPYIISNYDRREKKLLRNKLLTGYFMLEYSILLEVAKEVARPCCWAQFTASDTVETALSAKA